MNQNVPVPSPYPRPKLYSMAGIDVATFFGSWLAGAVLVSRNYRSLGEHDAARNALLLGVVSTLALAFVIYSIVVPATARVDAHVILAAQVAAVHLVVSWVQGDALESHASTGGEFFSRWRAFGVSLLVLPVAMVLFMIVAALFPNLPALRK